MAARRALDLGLISKKDFAEFYKIYSARFRESARKARGNFYTNQPLRVGARFGYAVVRAVREGSITYTEAYSLTGLHGSTFDNYAAGILV